MKTMNIGEIVYVRNLLVPEFMNITAFNDLMEYCDTWNQIHENIYTILNKKHWTCGGNNNSWMLHSLKNIIEDSKNTIEIKDKINNFIEKYLYSDLVYFRFLFWSHHRNEGRKYLYTIFDLKLADDIAYDTFFIKRDKLDSLYALSYIMEK